MTNARECPFRLGPHRERDAGRDEVEDDDRRVVIAGDRVRVADRELGMRPAADRDEDPLDLLGPTLLDDRDVARGVADDLVDGRREDRRAVAVASRRRAAAPAEDDEVGLLLGRGLDDALGGVPADAHDRVDRRAVRGVVEHALEQPTGVARPGGALRERHPLGHFDDAERRDLAVLAVEHRGAEADQLLGRHRVGDRDQDAHGERRPARHPPAAVQRSTRYGFNSSNSRACRSTRSSAASVGMLRFSMTKLPTRPK